MKTKSTERETPLAQERRDVTGSTHDGTAGRRRGTHANAQRWVALAFSLAEWEKLVRGEYGAEFFERDVCIQFPSFVGVPKGGRTLLMNRGSGRFDDVP